MISPHCSTPTPPDTVLLTYFLIIHKKIFKKLFSRIPLKIFPCFLLDEFEDHTDIRFGSDMPAFHYYCFINRDTMCHQGKCSHYSKYIGLLLLQSKVAAQRKENSLKRLNFFELALFDINYTFTI